MTQAILNKARNYCDKQGARFTPLREKVYSIMLQKQGPVGAYELLDELKATESGAKPATVYRTLDFLLDFGFIHRLESSNAFVACHHFDCSHPVQFLICDNCGEVTEIQSIGLEETLLAQAKQHGFKVANQTIEAHGLCVDCQQDPKGQ